jgi:hypothetical protein
MMHDIPNWVWWLLANFKQVATVVIVLLIAGFICAVWVGMDKKGGEE